jgi:O-antigen ligase
MTSRHQLLALAGMCAVAGVVVVLPQTIWTAVLVLAAGLTFLTAFPLTTLRLLLLSLSFDQVLDLRVSDAVNIRLGHVCAGVLLCQLVIRRLRSGGTWRLPLRALQPLGLYLVAAVASVCASENVSKSIGYLTWACFDFVALFAVILDIGRTRDGFAFIIRWWVAGAVLAASFGLVQLGLGLVHLPVPLAAQRLGEFPRINGFNYEPAYFAFYLESVAAVMLGVWLRTRQRRYALIALYLLLPAALSMSRSGWLGLGCLTAFSAVWLAAAGRLSGIGSTALRIGAVAALLLLLLPARFISQAPKMAEAAMNPKEASSSAPRLGMLSQARKIFAQNPLLGVGLGGYGGYLVSHPELLLAGEKKDAAKMVTTNLWLEVGSETGLVGIFAVAWIVLNLCRSLWRASWFSGSEESAWCFAFLMSVVLIFAILYQFNQTLWRLDVWVLMALGWASVLRVRSAQDAPIV